MIPSTGDGSSLQVSHIVAVVFPCLLEQPFLASVSWNILAFPLLFLMSLWLVSIPLVASVSQCDNAFLVVATRRNDMDAFFLLTRSLHGSSNL